MFKRKPLSSMGTLLFGVGLIVVSIIMLFSWAKIAIMKCNTLPENTGKCVIIDKGLVSEKTDTIFINQINGIDYKEIRTARKSGYSINYRITINLNTGGTVTFPLDLPAEKRDSLLAQINALIRVNQAMPVNFEYDKRSHAFFACGIIGIAGLCMILFGFVKSFLR